MPLIQGFKLLNYIADVSVDYFVCDEGMVDHNPSIKWQFEKVNPIDPTDIWKLGKYRLDTFSCKLPISPEGVSDLIDFIDGATELRIEFNHGKDGNGDPITKQYIINTIKKLPEIPDNLHEFDEFTKFDLESRYETYPTAIGGVIDSISFISRTSSHVGAFQGIAWDGTYFYTAAGIWEDQFHIYKYNSSWVQQDTVDTQVDLPGDATQINSILYKDGYLYLGVNNWEGPPIKGWIVVYDASDLSYVSIHPVKDYYCEGCAFHDGYWWVVYGGGEAAKIVSKYDTDWVHQADYNLTFPQTGTENLKGYQAIRWIGDFIYVNTHGGITPHTLDCYHWNGSGFRQVSRLTPPSSKCTQGIDIDTENKFIWWAERDYVYLYDHRVVKASYTLGPWP